VTDHDAVFETFRAFHRELGRIDRALVNAGLGKGAAIGTGGFRANRETLEVNLVAALAQCEAAVELFRAQRAGHLVVVSSVSAVRGMRGPVTAYAASKAGLSHLAEGIRAELLGTPIRVTTIHAGYVRSEMTERLGRLPFIVDTETGARALVRAVEREPATAYVPWWPWAAIALLLRVLPLRLAVRIAG
jgi:NAD(P)-dependent dehydrogenase (short-subunit alcohol dehydrogenase family)